MSKKAIPASPEPSHGVAPMWSDWPEGMEPEEDEEETTEEETETPEEPVEEPS